MAEEKTPTFDWLPEGFKPLADGEYDAIVMGTGLKECVISGLLSVSGKKVLHIDRNGYYGADCASLNLTNLYQKFNAGEVPSTLGSNRDYNVDLIPKFIMACGNLTKMLLHSKVTNYLEFKSIDGSYVYKGGKVYKVPTKPEEALRSTIIGLLEKRVFRKFLIFIDGYVPEDPKTHQGYDLNKITMRELYASFKLTEGTQEFISHAMCLQTDDTHLDQPARIAVKELQTYCYSLSRYGTSPYIYPVYGLGGLPEGFSRLCAVNGGTFMLNRDVTEIVMDENGQACGVKSDDEMAKAKMVIGDPSYFPRDKVKATGKVARCICFLNHPIPDTNDNHSSQIIIPGRQVGRTNDIFVCSVGSGHCVSARGVYIAIVSTTMETENAEAELKPGLDLLGAIMQKFMNVVTTYEPVGDGSVDKCYISSSFDGSSHFESDCDDLLSLYKRVTGEDLDMTINADTLDTQADY